MKINKSHVGKRLLISQWCSATSPFEVTVLDVSPSEKACLLRHRDGYEAWADVDKWQVLEELPITDKEST